jgi:hypothetical protein
VVDQRRSCDAECGQRVLSTQLLKRRRNPIAIRHGAGQVDSQHRKCRGKEKERQHAQWKGRAPEEEMQRDDLCRHDREASLAVWPNRLGQALLRLRLPLLLSQFPTVISLSNTYAAKRAKIRNLPDQLRNGVTADPALQAARQSFRRV